MAKQIGSDDQEQLFLDNVIALAGRIVTATRLTYGETDDPDVIDRLLQIERDAMVILVRVRDYRPRLDRLKSLALSTGKDLRTKRQKKSPAAETSGAANRRETNG